MSTARTILIALGFVLWSGPTQAHARLDHASPAAGSTVSSSPSEIALYFTEELEPKFSGGEVRSAAGARVDHASAPCRQGTIP
jgi:copper resistance protein C